MEEYRSKDKPVSDKVISPAVIKRLPRYYRYLGDLLRNGVDRISSRELSEKMNVTASQIRQDLNNFGGFGQQGYGYNVDYLYHEIAGILGLNKVNNIIIIGAGNLGQALANNSDFEHNGFHIIGLFDVNPELIDTKIKGVEVYDIKTLKRFIKCNDVKIAALTLPSSNAATVARQLVSLGVKAIWNFAPMDLSLPEDVIIENVNLSESLMTLSYRIHSN